MHNTIIPVITIDGPSGCGKGTMALKLARHLQWHFLDSGVLYRAVAIMADKQQLALTDEASLATIAAELPIRFMIEANTFAARIELAHDDVTAMIRHEKWGVAASQLAIFPKVRQALVTMQRSFRQAPGLVTDGRDMGTIIFPDADIKFFLTATVEERAKRRLQQLKDSGISVSLHSLLADLESRDKRDRERKVAPLQPADDALVIDTSTLNIEQVFSKIVAVVTNRLK